MKFLRSLLEATKAEKSPISGSDIREYSRQVDTSFKGDKNHKAGKTKRSAYANTAMDCIDNCPKHGGAEEHHKSAAVSHMWNKYQEKHKKAVSEALDDSAFNSGDAEQENSGTTDIQDNPHALAVWIKSGRQIARFNDYPNTSEGYKSFMKDLVDKFVVTTGDEADHRDYKAAKNCIQEYSNIHPKELKQASSTDLDDYKEVPVKGMDMDKLHSHISDTMNVRSEEDDDAANEPDPNKAGQSMRNQGDGGFTESTTTGASMKFKELYRLMSEAELPQGKPQAQQDKPQGKPQGKPQAQQRESLAVFTHGGAELQYLPGYAPDEAGFQQFLKDFNACINKENDNPDAGPEANNDLIHGEFGLRLADPEEIARAKERGVKAYPTSLEDLYYSLSNWNNYNNGQIDHSDVYDDGQYESFRLEADIKRLTEKLAKLKEGWDDSGEDRDVAIADAELKKDKKALSPRAEAAIAKKVNKLDKKAEDKAAKTVAKAKSKEEVNESATTETPAIKGSFAKFLETK